MAKQTTKLVRPHKGGQITIPAEFRRELGITEQTVLQVKLEGRELRVRPVREAEETDGSRWLKDLYDLFAPVREQAARYSEAEVNAAIDQAVQAVRRDYATRRL